MEEAVRIGNIKPVVDKSDNICALPEDEVESRRPLCLCEHCLEIRNQQIRCHQWRQEKRI